MLAPTPDAAFDPEGFDPQSVAAAYAALGLPRDARRSEIRSAYRKLVLKVHPDRRRQQHRANEASDDGAAFRRLKAAYDCLVKHTQFDQELDELDEQIEAEERELVELETKRFERELREKAIADIKAQRARRQAEEAKELVADAEVKRRRRRRREDEETHWLEQASKEYTESWRQRGRPVSYNDVHRHRERLVQDDAEEAWAHGPPEAVTLRLWNGAPLHNEFSPMWDGARLLNEEILCIRRYPERRHGEPEKPPV